jgi:hypothetical protein
MICIVGTRGSGKTAELLKFSADSGIPIAVHDSNRATSLHMLMEMLDIDAPDPVVIGNGVYGGRPSCSLAMKCGKDGLAPVLVDGLESFFGAMGLRADVVTVNADALNIDFELAAKANPSLLNYLRYRREIRKGGTK